MKFSFCLLSRSTLKPCKAWIGHQTRENVSQGRNRKRFRSAGPSHIMEVKQTETVDLEMTSPANAPLPDAQCREYLFSNAWQGKRTLQPPFIAIYLFAKLCWKHIVSQDECETGKKDSKEQLLPTPSPSSGFSSAFYLCPSSCLLILILPT